ncbi:hypothetical protein L1049_017530 [Liquidambar formosana]|uniref:Uncharacterized protein n=1 Tax=Liquidambar formosana TaxID=63359 RepID=A0AAP0X1B6_LIQFO
MVGDALRRGISGGQKKRLTTGEMIVGPTKALFMDEISNGLDSSTTFQIVTCLQQLVHITDATVLVSLLQPAPETFDLFDEVILMAEGKIVYHGPCSHALKFFEDCGFKCPERKGIADFLQEVISRKDQAQYWYPTDLPYSYVSVEQFSETFKASYKGENLNKELSEPYDKSQCHKNALSFSIYSLSKWELLKACMAREWLLMKRNFFVYAFKTTQLLIIALMTMTVFTRTQMSVDLNHASYYMGSLFYALVRLMTNGIAELSLTVSRLPVFYKQRAFYLYPAWAYAIPAFILKLPVAMIESILWTALTYYAIGYSPEVERFFCQIILLFALHQAATSFCRFMAAIFQTSIASANYGLLVLILMLLFGGYIIPKPSLPAWLKWGFWLSPMAYGEIGIAINEFLAPRWQKVSTGNSTLGRYILSSYGLNFDAYFYWISLGALFLFMLIFDLGFTLALTYLKPPGTSQAIISKEKLSQLQGREESKCSRHLDDKSTLDASSLTTEQTSQIGRTVLPFEPLIIAFRDVQYFVDTPPLILMKKGGQIIYSGKLGHHSSKLIEYFEGISGLPKIKDNYNPATWMLEVTSTSVEMELNLDFTRIYKESPLYRDTIELVRQSSEPPPGSRDLQFPTRFPQNGWGQYKACLWKQSLSYWRNPEYNLLRSIFMIALAVLFGVVFWQKGKDINNEQDLFSILGSMYIAVIFLGISYCSSIIPVVETERDVLYREKFAGMYSSKAYSYAQVTIEIPYMLVQAIVYVAITYPMIGFQWSAHKVFWYFYASFCSFLYFVYLGMMLVSLSPNLQVANIFAALIYTILNIFSGYLIPGPQIPKWWVWCYWICPTSWSLNGLLTSQYGDIKKEIIFFGEPTRVSSFLEDYYGYYHDRLGLVAAVLLGISGLPKIKDNYNPATWMLEITSTSVEVEMNLDFARIYKESPLYCETIDLVRQLSEPPPGLRDLQFPTRFPQNSWEQYKACLWKQHLSYWRNSEYNLGRLMFMIALAILFGVVFWQKGKHVDNEQDVFSILGSMYIAIIFLGIVNCSSVIPVVATERTVLYREKFAGMYSSKAYSLAQVTIEIPYILLQAILYVAITYPTIGFHWSAYKIFWYFYATFCSFLYYVYLGMTIVSLSSNLQVATILAVAVYTILNLFSGFLMPGPEFPQWWVWCYWICPTSWSLNGLLTSQYGDINKEILAFGEPTTVNSFLQDYYGFYQDRLGLVAAVLLAYPLLYASLFTYFIGKFNFQRRKWVQDQLYLEYTRKSPMHSSSESDECGKLSLERE